MVKKKGSKKRRGGEGTQNAPGDIFSDVGAAYEPSDSEDEYSHEDKMLLEKVRSRSSQPKTSKVAVMDLPSSEEEEEDDYQENVQDEDGDSDDDDDDVNMDSDIEGKENDLNLPDQRAWGKTKKRFYNTDYVDQDYGGFDGEDAAAAELEEQEAREIQKRLAAELDDNDFTLDVFTKTEEDTQDVAKPSEEVIKTDLSQLSTRQKIALLHKEAPELPGIISEFNDAMKELSDHLQPAIALVHRKQVSSPYLSDFIRTKYHLMINYALNMGFYLLLRARHLPVAAHPVVKRILQYRQLLEQLKPFQSTATNQIEKLINAAEMGLLTPLEDKEGVSPKHTKKPLQLLSVAKAVRKEFPESLADSGSDSDEPSEVKVKNKSIVSGKDRKSKDNEDAIKERKGMDAKQNGKPGNDLRSKKPAMPWANTLDEEGNNGTPWDSSSGSEDEGGLDESGAQDGPNDEDSNSKRNITWQMEKNKGLTPRNKREKRNARVKHRNRFRKAKIRRKGQVREPRTEVQRYGGEISGIKKTVSKSRKLK